MRHWKWMRCVWWGQGRRENNEGLKACNIEKGSRQTAFINSICFCKRVWSGDLCRIQPSSIIFSHYARADKIRADTCLLGEGLNNKLIRWNFVNLLSVSWPVRSKTKPQDGKFAGKLIRLQGISQTHKSWAIALFGIKKGSTFTLVLILSMERESVYIFLRVYWNAVELNSLLLWFNKTSFSVIGRS